MSVRFRLLILPSPYGCGLDPRGFSLSRPQCVHCCYGPVTCNLPSGGLVDRLRRLSFPLLRYPNYGALTSTPAALFPAEHASLHWTHNRTCGLPAYGSHCPAAPLPPPSLLARQRFQLNCVCGSRLLVVTAHGIGRVKKVTSDATRLIAAFLRETMSRVNIAEVTITL